MILELLRRQTKAFSVDIIYLKVWPVGATLSVKLDDVDKEILKILQEDARRPYAKIASQLKVTEGTIRFRVGKLLREGVITRFMALIDPRKVGMQVTAVVMLRVEAAFLDEVFNQLVSLHESQHVFQSTGEYDIVAIMHAHDLNHLGNLMNRIKSFAGVRNASVSVITRLVRVEPTLKL